MSFNATKFFASFILVLAGIFQINTAAAQCTVTLNNGRTLTLSFTPTNVVTANCGNSWGYNYDYKINYTITANGPISIYWIGASFQSGVNGESFNFGLNTLGTGTLTTGNGQGRYINDCATATPASLNIRNLVLTISTSEGSVTTNCNFVTAPSSGSSSTTSGNNSVNGATPLPVKLVSFDAELAANNQVNLTWITAQENNNAYFIVERSADAKTWSELTKMNGAGTTNYSTTYNYTDEQPVSGTNYYRLKQVDADGAATYSQTVSVKAADRKADAVTLYPNPNSGENIRFAGLQNSADWSIRIVNSSSALVYQAATVSEEIALPALPAGLYFVQLHNSKTGEAQLLKLMRK